MKAKSSTLPLFRIVKLFIFSIVAVYFVFLGVSSFVGAAPPSVIVDKKVSNETPAPGEQIEFTIRYRCASLTDNCYNTVITDVVPSNFEIDGYTGAGGWVSSVESDGQTLAWNLGSGSPRQLDAGSIGSITIYAHVPACNDGSVIAATSATNTAEMAAYENSLDPLTAVSGTDSVNINIPEVPQCVEDNSSTGPVSVEKSIRGQGALVGLNGTREYRLSFPLTTTEYVVTDEIPSNGIVMRISDQNQVSVEIECGDTGVFHSISGGLVDAGDFSSELDPIADCLYEAHPTADGEFVTNITAIRWTRADTNATVRTSDVSVSFLTDNPFAGETISGGGDALPNWSAPTIGEKISNCAVATVWGTTDCSLLTVVAEGIWPRLSKSIVGSPSLAYEGLIGLDATANPPRVQGPSDMIYRIDVEGYTYGTGDWPNPVVVDLLDSDLEYIPYPSGYSWWALETDSRLTDPDCQLPEFTAIENYNGSGRTLLRWDFKNCTIPTDSIREARTTDWITIEFGVRIKEGTLAATEISNVSAVFVDGDIPVADLSRCNTGSAPLAEWPDSTDVNDVDGDGLTDEVICRSPQRTYDVPTISDMTSSKWVQGALDSSYSRFPFNGLTDLSSEGAYQLYVENTGNVTMTVVDMIDILPFDGDTGVLPSTGARGSAWTAVLGEAIVVEKWNGSSYVDASGDLALGGAQYSTSQNPCRFENSTTDNEDLTADGSVAVGPSGCDSNPWGATAVGASAFSVRFAPASGGLLPGEHLRLTASIVISGNPPGCGDATCTVGSLDADAIAWNSFAFGGTFDNNGSPSRLLDSEPIKVGLEMFDTTNTASLGDYVWFDSNGNGVQDAGEAPVQGVTVSLYQAGTKIGDATTDANGFYSFYGLTPLGSYTVTMETANDFTSGSLKGYSLTAQDQGGDDEKDSDAAIGSNGYPVINATAGAAGENDGSYDFGFWEPASIGNRVWYDVDSAGDQGIGDTGAVSVTVTLKQPGPDGLAGTADDTTVGTQQTDADGYYLFTDLPEGQYFLEFDYSTITGTEPLSNTTVNRDEWAITIASASGNTNTDSDVSSGGTYTGTTILTYLSAGETDLSWDMGLKPVIIPANPVSVGNFVWEDTTNNNVQDVGEPGIADVRVELYDENGLPLDVTYTDSNGYYQFDNLEDNTAYQLRFVAPDGFTLVNQNAGGDSIDSDVDSTTGFVSFVLSTTAAVGDPDSTATLDARWDAGMLGTLSIGNLAWFDLNGDGDVDSGEPALAGLTVRLLDSDNGNSVVVTTTTDINGRYLFDNLSPGNYIVEIEMPAGTTTTLDTSNSSNPGSGDDNDDNGTDDVSQAGFVRSNVIALTYGSGDNGEADHGIEINGVADTTLNRNADYTLDFGFVKRDFGDLIDTGDGSGSGDYNTNDTNAASHTVWDTDNDNIPDVSGAIWLGASVDGEANGQPASNPNGANGDGGDEDGVVFDVSDAWTPSTTVADAISVTVSGSGLADVGVWIDWNDDGVFDTFVELSGVSAGLHTLDVDAPASYIDGGPVNIRVRAFDAGTSLDLSTGFRDAYSNGEVEDYQLTFGPTAVSLKAVGASGSLDVLPTIWLFMVTLVLMSITTVAFWFSRKPESLIA